MIGQQLLSLMYGDPADQIARTLNPGGPNPNPGAPQPPSGAPGAAPGGGGGSGAAAAQPSSQPPLAPANATQSPPDLAALYTQLHAQDRSANQIDRGVAMMASAFGTQQQQHDMMGYAQSLRPDERALVASQGLQDQAKLTAQREHSKFIAGAAGMAKLLDVDAPTAQWLALNPDAMNEALSTHFANKKVPETVKLVDSAVADFTKGHPDATPEEIANYRSGLISGALGGPAAEAMKVQARNSQEFKDTAIEDYNSVTTKLNESQTILKQLLDDPDHVMSALTNPLPKTGLAGYWTPSALVSQETKNKAVLIDQLMAKLTGQSLTDVKNVRNSREFNVLGQSLTAALNPANSKGQVIKALEAMNDKILDARAVAEASVGHHLSGDLAGRTSTRDLLSPTLHGKPNPYYAGATEDEKSDAAAPSGGGGKTYTYNPKTGQLE